AKSTSSSGFSISASTTSVSREYVMWSWAERSTSAGARQRAHGTVAAPYMRPWTITFSPTLWMSTSAPAREAPRSMSTPLIAFANQVGSKGRDRLSPSGPISWILMIISDIYAHCYRTTNAVHYSAGRGSQAWPKASETARFADHVRLLAAACARFDPDRARFGVRRGFRDLASGLGGPGHGYQDCRGGRQSNRQSARRRARARVARDDAPAGVDRCALARVLAPIQ